MDDRIARIRNFNRVITRRLGALDSSFLGCGVSLGKARLLFEIANGIVGVQKLRAKLGFDSGQMSRMLRSLEKGRLIETSVDPADARARILKLTRTGKAKLNELERKADEGAQSWLAPLSVKLQVELQAAMAEVVRILKASEVVIQLEDPRSDAAGWCLDQFFRELNARFDAGFDPGLATSASPEEVTPPAGYFLLATLLKQPVGCAALKLSKKERIGEIKRMWVSEELRGLGIGRRLLESLELRAQRSGVKLLRLSTNRSLNEAQKLYRASGYEEAPVFDDEPYAHLAFEKHLT
jgi:DNA-binding MarR family transcriptional regulator/N-acetylglutamate synthase-like GNAT family acetyltransferase